MMPSPEIAYSLLSVADKKFTCHPSELDASQREEALRIAQRQFAIEDAVLSSQEANEVSVPASAIDEAYAQIHARYADEAAFIRALETAGIELSSLRNMLERALLVEAVMEHVAQRSLAIGDTEARLYYYMNHQQFNKPETRTARHILITINPDFPENERDNAFKKAQTILRRVDKKPERFAEQAFKHSECPTALQGGLLGEVKRGQLFPSLDTVLFSLPAGSCSEITESPMGFHILLCERIHQAGLAPLQEILPRLQEQLNQRQKRILQRKWLENILIDKENNASVEHLS